MTWSTPGLHKITWTSCCRGRGSNFVDNEAGLFAALYYNPQQPSSSPQFYDLPVFNFPVDKPISYNFNVEDPDGQELEYSLEKPYGMFEDPYASMTQKGFKLTNDGKIVWDKPVQGLWLVNVKVKEKANGAYTGAYVLREFILNIGSFTNEAPQFAPLAQKFVKEGEAVSFDVEASDSQNITINASGSVFEKGASFKQTVQGAAAKGTFSWTPALGTSGKFVVQFTATDAHIMPLTSQAAVTVTVVPANCGVLAAPAIKSQPCEGSSNGQVTVAGSNGLEPFLYSLDGGTTFKTEALFTNLAAGTYQAVVKDASGCLSAPVPVTLQGQAALSVSFTTAFKSVCASGNPIRLTGGSPVGGSYSGTGVKDGVFNPATAGPGAHTISYTYTNGNGCTNTATTTLTVAAAPTASAGTDQTVYYGYAEAGCATLSATATGGSSNYTYSWSTGAATQAISVCPTATTTYTVTVTDASGCSSTDDVTVFVTDVRCGNKLDKVSVCHNGNEICIAPEAVAAHLAHGDVLGSCATGGNLKAQSAGNMEASAATQELSVYPNPMGAKAQVTLKLKEQDYVTLEILDNNGKVVKKLYEGTAAANQEQSFEIRRSIGNQPLYIARLTTSKGTQFIRIMLAD
ncbi:T9SS type A sorting domain-containing protein [Pontibacter russatus]|uniref:T9SS type A sorting domain-containing protein n=1 Tax=Pontibacter russatus TaxID=2694929 RepID=UPI001379418D|nr:T9SS type A sorting domain-containing protein [Pontibacter russatus]